MKIRFLNAILILTTWPILASGQSQVKIVSACEVLANLSEYGNAVVAVVGRLDVTGVIYDRRSYVSQDGCANQIVTENYVWPNKILIWTVHEKGLPNPPNDKPELDRSLLAEKVAGMKGTTSLGLRNEFRADKNGQLVNFIVQNEWVVAYGHTYYSPHLTTAESCKEFGCDGFSGKAPVIITVDPKNVHTIKEDGTFSGSEKPSQ